MTSFLEMNKSGCLCAGCALKKWFFFLIIGDGFLRKRGEVRGPGELLFTSDLKRDFYVCVPQGRLGGAELTE